MLNALEWILTVAGSSEFSLSSEQTDHVLVEMQSRPNITDRNKRVSEIPDCIMESVSPDLINLDNLIKVFCYPNRVLYHIANEDVLRLVLLIYFGIVLVICILFSLYSCCKRTSTNGNSISWRVRSNRNLQIMIASLVWCCVINIAIVMTYPTEHITEICYKDDRPPACFAVESFSGCYFAFATFGIFLMLQNIECKKILKKTSNKRMEIVISCVLAFAFTICEGGHHYGREDVQIVDRDRNIWQSNYPKHVIVIGLISIVGDWVIVCLIFPVVHVIIFHHFYLFWHIMGELSAPIYAKRARDIAGWWELTP
eukprot:1063545_1